MVDVETKKRRLIEVDRVTGLAGGAKQAITQHVSALQDLVGYGDLALARRLQGEEHGRGGEAHGGNHRLAVHLPREVVAPAAVRLLDADEVADEPRGLGLDRRPAGRVPRGDEAERSEANRDVPMFQAHGTFDPMVPVERGEAARDRLVELGYDVTWNTYPMEHQVHPDEIRDIGAWLAERLA